MFLVGGQVAHDRGVRVGERLRGQPEAVEQGADPGRSFRRRDARLDADPAGSPQPVGHRLAVQQFAVTCRGLDGMTQRVPQVERDPTVGRDSLTFVGGHHRDLGPRRPFDQLRDGTRVEAGRVASRDRGAVRLEQLEQPLVAEGRHLDRLAQRGPKLSLGERPERVDVDDDRARLVEGPHQVLALGEVDAGLATDGRVDLGDEGGRDLDEPDAAEVDGSEEARRIAECASAEATSTSSPLDSQGGELPGGRLDHRQALRRLAFREHDRSTVCLPRAVVPRGLGRSPTRRRAR